MNEMNFYKTHCWYPSLSGNTLLTGFVKLSEGELASLANGEVNDTNSKAATKRLKTVMHQFSGSCFVSSDVCSPTDTERFRIKHGAVHSATSAWKVLAKSEKVKQAAKNGEFDYLVVRPYRRMNPTREFRLFVWNGELVAMSQYHLIRHFRRLEGIKKQLWSRAENFFDKVKDFLVSENQVLDVYFTSDNKVILIDVNRWGGETNPLMLRNWEQDWQAKPGIILMPPPTKISGNVNVSF